MHCIFYVNIVSPRTKNDHCFSLLSFLPSPPSLLTLSLLHPHSKQPSLQRRFVQAQGTSPVIKKSNLGPLKSVHLHPPMESPVGALTNNKRQTTANKNFSSPKRNLRQLLLRACIYELFLKQQSYCYFIEFLCSEYVSSCIVRPLLI